MNNIVKNNKSRPLQAVILAGGLGTRLRPITDTIPKPMIPFHGKPFLEYIIEMLIEQGFVKIILLLGYLPEKVTEYFGNGAKWGIDIKYSITDINDDTGLRLKKAKHLFENEFMLLYCDNYWPMNFNKMLAVYKANDVDALVTVYKNLDGYTKNNLQINENGFIEVYDKTRQAENLQGVDIGFFILKKSIVDLIPDGNFKRKSVAFRLSVNEKGLEVLRHSNCRLASLLTAEVINKIIPRGPKKGLSIAYNLGKFFSGRRLLCSRNYKLANLIDSDVLHSIVVTDSISASLLWWLFCSSDGREILCEKDCKLGTLITPEGISSMKHLFRTSIGMLTLTCLANEKDNFAGNLSSAAYNCLFSECMHEFGYDTVKNGGVINGNELSGNDNEQFGQVKKMKFN